MSKRKSIAQLREETKSDLTYEDLPVGTRVRIVTPYQDCYFWDGEQGIVEKNSGEYLGVVVRLDEPRVFEGQNGPSWPTGSQKWTFKQERHGFKPEDLELLEKTV